jgi:single-strand DNA-binding protein
MNKVILIGRLCADPEIRYTQNNKPVATYRLAVDRPFKQDGQPATDFLNCVAWNRSAEFVSKNLVKGTKIAIEGRIQTRNYEDKDGKTVYVTEIVVDHHEFCERRAAATEDTAPEYSGMSDADDSLPF